MSSRLKVYLAFSVFFFKIYFRSSLLKKLISLYYRKPKAFNNIEKKIRNYLGGKEIKRQTFLFVFTYKKLKNYDGIKNKKRTNKRSNSLFVKILQVKYGGILLTLTFLTYYCNRLTVCLSGNFSLCSCVRISFFISKCAHLLFLNFVFAFYFKGFINIQLCAHEIKS